MADVFLSYAREDSARAAQVAQGLQQAGLDVFWDNEIPPGTTWADYIEQKLTQCKALIVLWSEHSTKSQWVREEARMGRDKGVLIPVMMDASTPPFGFGEVQAANLADWNGDPQHVGWKRFVAAVTSISQTTPAPRPAMSTPPRDPAPAPQAQAWTTAPSSAPASEKKSVPVWVWVVGAVVATVVVLGIAGTMMQDDETGSDTPTTVAEQQQAPPQLQQPQMQQQQAPQGNEGQVLMQQLQQAEARFAQEGFQPVGQPFAGGLTPGQSWNVPGQVVAGYEYRVIGVCDQHCTDLDLALYAQDGSLISQDTSADDHPIVGAVVSVTQNITIQATMFQCQAQGCYYALALYGRPAQ